MRPAGLKCLILFAGVASSVALTRGAHQTASLEDSLSARESRGKQIYMRGTSPSGEDIFAYIGDSSLELPGAAMPCANCHGLDGKGKPEGSVYPSNLTREELTKPYGLTHPDGRRHPAYTEQGIELAITRGTDPAGNKLSNVMPRYQMSREDLADLIAYLGRLGKDLDPGISDDSIVIGAVLPPPGPLTEMGQAVRAVTVAFFDSLRARGGVYGRNFELRFAEAGATPADTRANVERLITEDHVFVITAAFIAGSEKEVVPLLARKEVPMIGPFTLFPQTGFPLNRQVFYLLSGIDGQARALVEFAARRPEFKNVRLAIVYPKSEVNTNAFGAIQAQVKEDGLAAPHAVEYVDGRFEASDVARRLKQSGCGAIFFLGGSRDALSLLREAEQLGWFPFVLLANAGGGEILDAPSGFNRRVFLAFPNSPADQTADGLTEFRDLAEKYKLPNHHLAAQISAYCANKLLVEALRRAGKEVSREKLIQALEGFYEYQTGLTPPITYGANRRIGAMGSYVVTLDLEQKRFSPASAWININ